MHGITNAGTHRLPVFEGVEECTAPTMQGTLEASVTIGESQAASPARVVMLRGVYKLAFPKAAKEGVLGPFEGTFEGVVMFICDI
jgi:hypothetical protein